MVVVFTHIGLHGDEVEATCIDGNANWNVCLASQFYLLLTVVCPFYTLEEPDLAGCPLLSRVPHVCAPNRRAAGNVMGLARAVTCYHVPSRAIK